MEIILGSKHGSLINTRAHRSSSRSGADLKSRSGSDGGAGSNFFKRPPVSAAIEIPSPTRDINNNNNTNTFSSDVNNNNSNNNSHNNNNESPSLPASFLKSFGGRSRKQSDINNNNSSSAGHSPTKRGQGSRSGSGSNGSGKGRRRRVLMSFHRFSITKNRSPSQLPLTQGKKELIILFSKFIVFFY
jgi:hypothetical protein